MLSKSKLLSYRQCPKRLWLEKHRQELMEVSDATQAGFLRGHGVGDVSRALYGPGELLFDQKERDYASALKKTADHIARKSRTTLFEAAFSANGVFVMADVLKLGSSGATMVEVKASTSVKDYHIDDCATQKHVAEAAGVRVQKILVAHVDKSFVYLGDGQYKGLLREVNVGKEVAALQDAVPEWIRGANKTLAGDEPDIRPGKQCTHPYPCPFFNHCNKQTAEYPVTVLPHLSKQRAEAWALRGINDVRDVPRVELDNPIHQRVFDATRNNKTFVDRAAASALSAQPYPRYYLDFETIQFAVPIWAGTRPYQQLPFQWSVHVEAKSETLEHFEFLDVTGQSPLRRGMERLIRTLGTTGPIFVYSGFEARVLKDMALMYPDLAVGLSHLCERLFDLLPIARSAYYHPSMMGSWSIKSLLPAIAPEMDYSNLVDIRDGGAAQQAFLEAINSETGDDRRKVIRENLLAYCGHDTLAMVQVAEFLQGKS